MKDLLRTLYDIHVDEKIVLNQLNGYRSGEHFYFTMPAFNKETIHMEQADLGYFLTENGYPHMAVPVPAINGEWYLPNQEQRQILMRVHNWSDGHTSHGRELATFHQMGMQYPYEPREISSYGQWRQLWIDKLTAYEEKLKQDAAQYVNEYHRLMMDILPYIIGISENAIQYMQETEEEQRFDESDQGVIAFKRYKDQLQKPMLMATELVYDHAARDLAEIIRSNLLKGEESSVKEMVGFMREYQSIQNLSVFGWRMIYARLLYPVQLIDIMERGFRSEPYDMLYQELKDLLRKQAGFEESMAAFYELMGIDHTALQIPVLHWL